GRRWRVRAPPARARRARAATAYAWVACGRGATAPARRRESRGRARSEVLSWTYPVIDPPGQALDRAGAGGCPAAVRRAASHVTGMGYDSDASGGPSNDRLAHPWLLPVFGQVGPSSRMSDR